MKIYTHVKRQWFQVRVWWVFIHHSQAGVYLPSLFVSVTVYVEPVYVQEKSNHLCYLSTHKHMFASVCVFERMFVCVRCFWIDRNQPSVKTAFFHRGSIEPAVPIAFCPPLHSLLSLPSPSTRPPGSPSGSIPEPCNAPLSRTPLPQWKHTCHRNRSSPGGDPCSSEQRPSKVTKMASCLLS